MRRSTVCLFVIGVAIALVGLMLADGLIVSAQNSNSSPTLANSNANTGKMRSGSRRRGARKAAANTNTSEAPAAEMQNNQNANMAGAQENMNANTNMGTTTGKRRRGRRSAASTKAGAMGTETTMAKPQRTGRCDPTQQEQTDLSGTYTGKVTHGGEAAMDATLSISGNSFTMTSGSDTHSGRITAVTTCGYTAVTVMMGDSMTSGTNPPMTVSLRAKKVGDKLTLTSVPGEPQKIFFTTGEGTMRAKPRRHRMTKPKPAASPSTPQ